VFAEEKSHCPRARVQRWSCHKRCKKDLWAPRKTEIVDEQAGRDRQPRHYRSSPERVGLRSRWKKKDTVGQTNYQATCSSRRGVGVVRGVKGEKGQLVPKTREKLGGQAGGRRVGKNGRPPSSTGQPRATSSRRGGGMGGGLHPRHVTK